MHDYLNHGIFEIYVNHIFCNEAATISIRDNAVSMTRISVGQNCKFCCNPKTVQLLEYIMSYFILQLAKV